MSTTTGIRMVRWPGVEGGFRISSSSPPPAVSLSISGHPVGMIFMHRVQLVFCGGDCVSDSPHVLTVLIGQLLRRETEDDLVDFSGELKRGS